MPIDLFGWTIGDIAAVGALIASPLIFWIGYRRSRRTEEVKTVNDQVGMIDKAFGDIIRFTIKQPSPDDKMS